jgi:hypothetical protein
MPVFLVPFDLKKSEKERQWQLWGVGESSYGIKLAGVCFFVFF